MSGKTEMNQRVMDFVDNSMLKNVPAFLIEYRKYLSDEKKCLPQTIKMKLYYVIDYLKFIKKDINELSWDEISQDFFINNYFISKEKKQNGKPMSMSYQNTLLYILKDFFEYSKEKDYISSNPMEKKRKIKGTDINNRPRLKSEDFKKTLCAVQCGAGNDLARARQASWRERDELILQLFMTCGMRKSALASIDIDDIDFDKETLMVFDKGNRYHVYAISHLIAPIHAWLEKRKLILEGIDEKALFISNRKRRMSGDAIEGVVAKYSQEGIQQALTPHDLRAGLCTILVKEKGKDLQFTADIIGHRNIQTTSRYVVADVLEEKKESAKIMAEVCGL